MLCALNFEDQNALMLLNLSNKQTYKLNMEFLEFFKKKMLTKEENSMTIFT